MPKSTSVVIESSNSWVTAESEKNRVPDREAVTRFLYPQIKREWETNAPLFRAIGIETKAGCNATCSFCPVNLQADPRPIQELPLNTIKNISEQLCELSYSGTIQLFGNNEPLLDSRIIALVSKFRADCPNSEIRLLTNGLRLTVEFANALFVAGLTVLTINNYTDGSRLISPVVQLIEHADAFINHDVRISVRKIHEVLTSRAGRAPNKRTPVPEAAGGFCALPFVDMQIDYKGMVIGCCFDAYSEFVLGDVSLQSLSEIWFGDNFQQLRKKLAAGNRSAIATCSNCDFDGFADPMQLRAARLTRDKLVELG